MKRIISLVLCLLLLVSLCACQKEESTPAPTQAPAPATEAPTAAPTAEPAATPEPVQAPEGIDSYADAYLLYRSVCTALQEEVNYRLDVHNTALEEANPEGYFMDPAYLILVYMPFYTNGPTVGSALAAPDAAMAQEMMRAYWPDAVLQQLDEHMYQADYTYSDLPENGGATHQCTCTWEFDPAAGSFRVTGYTDGMVTEFTEFIPQGNDTYLLYTMDDKALVTLADGAVTELYHAHMINEPALGEFVGDVRCNSLMSFDFFPAVVADKEWISQETNARYILTLRDGDMTYTGKLAEDILSEDGSAKIGVNWTDAGTIVLENP